MGRDCYSADAVAAAVGASALDGEDGASAWASNSLAGALLSRLGASSSHWSAGTMAGVVSAAIALNILLCAIMTCVVIAYVRALHGRRGAPLSLVPSMGRGSSTGGARPRASSAPKPKRSGYRRPKGQSRVSTANEDEQDDVDEMDNLPLPDLSP